jgi:UDP-GlcNAc:undecaprenyl-phosphate/decaprenyl-phosphate GlcNAc-1-phosphate transferase
MSLILFLGFAAFLLSLVLTPLIRDFFLRRNIVDKPDRCRKLHEKAIPRLGGIAVGLAYAGAFLIVMLLPIRSEVLEVSLPGVWRLCAAACLVFLTGIVDDIVGLDPRWKMAEQLLAAGMAYMAGVQIHVIGGHWLDLWLSLPVTMLWLVACTNAFNLIDGLDGLAAGVGLFATLTVLVSALSHHNTSLAIVTIPLAGALIGFLRYNFNPASVFLGDSGSLLIGFLLGCYGVLWSQKSATILGMTAPLMAMSIPLLDASLAIVRRFLRSQPIFSADRGHIHHKLLDRGLTTRQTAVLLYGVSGIAAVLSLLQNSYQNELNVGGAVVVLFCVSAWLGVQHLGYTEFGTARQMFVKGTFQRIIGFQTRLQALERQLAGAHTESEFWECVVHASCDFGFSGASFGEPEQVEVHREWQVRIPMPDGSCMVLTHPFASTGKPVITSEFVRVVHTAAVARFGAPRPDQSVVWGTLTVRDQANAAQV